MQQKPGEIDALVLKLVQEGNIIHQQLLVKIRAVELSTRNLTRDCQLAIINYCAALLFICQSYAYYDCWDECDVPSLDQSQIKHLVNTITCLSENALRRTHIPGLLLLFPLRVVGTYATEPFQRTRVIDLLHQIHQKGFAISSWVQSDLQDLWLSSTIM
jgi:hypothetical protein